MRCAACKRLVKFLQEAQQHSTTLNTISSEEAATRQHQEEQTDKILDTLVPMIRLVAMLPRP